MTQIERFASNEQLSICVEYHPMDIEWTASFRTDRDAHPLSIHESGLPSLAIGSSALLALLDLVCMCRGKKLSYGRGLINVPDDLAL